MTSNIIQFPDDAVTVKDGKPITTSLRVAEIFGKRHDNVLRDIRALDCSPEFRLLNFGESSYINDQSKAQPMFEITKDGLVFLIMGYTGAKAAQFKEAYIARFNAMERRLNEQWLAQELEPVFDAGGSPMNLSEERKAQRRQMGELKALLFKADPRIKQIVRYKVAKLNHTEIGKLLGMNRNTVTRLVKQMAAAGLFRFSAQLVPGQSNLKNYPKAKVAPQVINLPTKTKPKAVEKKEAPADLFGGEQ